MNFSKAHVCPTNSTKPEDIKFQANTETGGIYVKNVSDYESITKIDAEQNLLMINQLFQLYFFLIDS